MDESEVCIFMSDYPSYWNRLGTGDVVLRKAGAGAPGQPQWNLMGVVIQSQDLGESITHKTFVITAEGTLSHLSSYFEGSQPGEIAVGMGRRGILSPDAAGVTTDILQSEAADDDARALQQELERDASVGQALRISVDQLMSAAPPLPMYSCYVSGCGRSWPCSVHGV